MTDLYGVLGVAPDAAPDEIAAAYRRRVRLTHPDTGGDAIAFRAVQKAYEILKDPGLRAGYDEERDPSSKAATGPSGADTADGKTGRGESGSTNESHSGHGHGRGSASGAETEGWVTISWAAAFLPSEHGERPSTAITIVPKHRLLVLLGVYALVAAWSALAGVIAYRYDYGGSLLGVVWIIGWLILAVITAAHTVRGSWAVVAIALAAAMAWPAYSNPGESWSWLVFVWLVGALGLPPLRARLSEPLFPIKRIRAGNVYGEARWEARQTAQIAEQLALIPAARIFHQVGPADHIVVVGNRAAIIAGPPATQLGEVTARAWPASITREPQRAVEEIGAWLLRSNDGRTVDRRALATIANL